MQYCTALTVAEAVVREGLAQHLGGLLLGDSEAYDWHLDGGGGRVAGGRLVQAIAGALQDPAITSIRLQAYRRPELTAGVEPIFVQLVWRSGPCKQTQTDEARCF